MFDFGRKSVAKMFPDLDGDIQVIKITSIFFSLTANHELYFAEKNIKIGPGSSEISGSIELQPRSCNFPRKKIRIEIRSV